MTDASIGEIAEFPEFREYLAPGLARRSGVARAMNRLLYGPWHPMGVSVDYHRIDIGPRDRDTWPRLAGMDADRKKDPTLVAPGLRLTWRYAACLALPAAVIDEVEKVYQAPPQPAVVRLTMRGDVIAGILPKPFGRYSPFEDGSEGRRTLLCRTGPVTVTEVAIPALVIDDTLLIPDKVEVLAEQVPLAGVTLWADGAKTPIV
jgi:hypothetical protein